MKKFNFSKVLGGLVIGGMLLSSGGVALAVDTISTTDKDQAATVVDGRGFGGGHHGGGFRGAGFGGPQADFDQLVKDGVITQEKVDKINAFIEAQAKERQTEMEKLKAMTSEERQAEMEKLRTERQGAYQGKAGHDLFDELVTNNILTQAEADKIQSTLQAERQAEQKAKLSEAIASLEKAGTITEAQGDKITAALEAAQAERVALRAKLDAMTDEERQQYFEDNKNTERTSPLQALITDKVITEKQAQALFQAMGPMHGDRGMGAGRGHFGGPQGMNGGTQAPNAQTDSAKTAE